VLDERGEQRRGEKRGANRVLRAGGEERWSIDGMNSALLTRA
jgi:hypothetical protein